MTSSNPAENEAQAAEARAEAARARADELRSRLQSATNPGTATEPPAPEAPAPEATDAETPEPEATDPAAVTPASSAPLASEPLPSSEPLSSASLRSRRRPIAAPLAAALSALLLAATGYMVWQHHQDAQRRQRAAEYVAAARQGIVNLMSIDYNTAQDSAQRVLEGSTGKFHDNFADTAEDFVKALKDEKIVTKATVNSAAVETMTEDSAVVMVSATSRREGAKAPEDQQQPRLWRIVLNLQREGDQIKMSGVEFV